MLNLTPYELSVDTLDVHAVSGSIIFLTDLNVDHTCLQEWRCFWHLKMSVGDF